MNVLSVHFNRWGIMKTKYLALLAVTLSCAGLIASPAYASEDGVLTTVGNVAPDLISNQELRSRLVFPVDTTGQIQLSNWPEQLVVLQLAFLMEAISEFWNLMPTELSITTTTMVQ